MKKLFCFLAAALLTSAVQAQMPADLIAHVHFPGAEKISADKNSAAFTNLFCSAQAQALEKQTLDKLAHLPYEILERRAPGGIHDSPEKFRPLLDDALRAEWLLNARDANNGSPEFTLAVRLDDTRAKLWSDNLAGILKAWTGLPVEKIPNGWQLKKHVPPDLFRFVRIGNWIVIGLGQEQLPLTDQTVALISRHGAPAIAGNDWLDAQVDWARLARWFPALSGTDLPKINLQITGSDGNLRLNGKIIFPRAPGFSIPLWQMPTNLIHEPFVSFTAARGVSPWLEKLNWSQRLDIPPPNQFFLWALPQIPFQTFAAAPVSDAKAQLAQLDKKINSGFGGGLQNPFLAPFTPELTNNEITWRGLPYIAPFMQALREPAGDFLFGGFFPNTPRGNPLPADLFRELNRNNLVYYHWEITAQRLPQILNLSQLGLLLTRHKQLAPQSAALKWILQIEPKLGNTVTEITQTAPNELTFTRKAPAGLTAAELIALGNWLEATNFPGCDLRIAAAPARPKNFKLLKRTTLSAPPAIK